MLAGNSKRLIFGRNEVNVQCSIGKGRRSYDTVPLIILIIITPWCSQAEQEGKCPSLQYHWDTPV